MHDYTSPEGQAAVTQLLLATHPSLLHRDEIIREIGNAPDVEDALVYLTRMGLAHELNGFFWATRAMMAAEEAVTVRP
jgi:hypothetical protein